MTMTTIIDHDDPAWAFRWERLGQNRWNGAYYYSRARRLHR